MKVKIKDIKIGDRIRRDVDSVDLQKLEESIGQYGLFNPVTINKHKELLAGFRRLEACKRLNWDSIEANEVNANTQLEKLDVELDENIKRNNLRPSELAEGLALRKQLFNKDKGITKGSRTDLDEVRQGSPIVRFDQEVKAKFNIPETTTRDRVAKGEKILKEKEELGYSPTAMEMDKPKSKPIKKPKEAKAIGICPHCKFKVGITEDFKLIKV